ncbi:hypothetical protein Tsubulata_009307 [Turnera subulata]|uniref:Uncharacterized protein n=1 Tax=Turnera subulata TaxID=218843 RepID=A0A9Q0FGD6_9ROSI|nr:hypothetical protein Tsubulata_009307 [Turnera subulata]
MAPEVLNKKELWPRSRCLECWCNTLHLALWRPSFLGRLVVCLFITEQCFHYEITSS